MEDWARVKRLVSLDRMQGFLYRALLTEYKADLTEYRALLLADRKWARPKVHLSLLIECWALFIGLS